MGITPSRLEKQLGPDYPKDVRLVGIQNQGNTCYANSVFQVLYHSQPFRKYVLSHISKEPADPKDPKKVICDRLFALISQIDRSKTSTSSIVPNGFISLLREQKSSRFSGTRQQDSHEFFHYLINTLTEITQKDKKPPTDEFDFSWQDVKTWVHSIFEGHLVNQTRCLRCENVRSRAETFVDIGVPITPYASLTQCLRNYATPEILTFADKYACENCGTHQEATTGLKISALPPILSLQLKRFHQNEATRKFVKLGHRVSFPFQLKVPSLAHNSIDENRLYRLYAIIVHLGSSLQGGHYIAYCRIGKQWIRFDDSHVSRISQNTVIDSYGHSGSGKNFKGSGYLLFYQGYQFRLNDPYLVNTDIEVEDDSLYGYDSQLF